MKEKQVKRKVKVTSEKLFDYPVNNELLALYVRVYLANQRQGNASTKTRAQVSGGGRKPWRQKGTGKARQGSIRAPHFVHGGIAFGPKPKSWSLSIPVKMRKVALRSALSLKEASDSLKVIDDLVLKSRKTFEMVKELGKHQILSGCLLVLPRGEKKLYLAGRNIKNLKIATAEDLTPYEILKAKSLVVTSKGLAGIKERI